MPGMNGLECAHRLKSVLPDLVIIMISGFDHPNGLAEALQAGAAGYLTKPLSVDQFLATLNRRQTKARPEPRPTPSPWLPAPDHGTGSTIQDQRTSAEPKRRTLIDDPIVNAALRRMVIRMEENWHTREDLLQKALVYLWLREQQCPGQKRNWYLLAVRNYLHHCRHSGRSLDSPKRRGAQAISPDRCGESNRLPDASESDEGIMSEVNAHDIFSLLIARLKPKDQIILRKLADGFGVCDIAEKVHDSHVFVIRQRRQIAELAMKLGINPLPPRRH